MTRLIEVIETTRMIYPKEKQESIPVHQHHQHVTPEGTLIVEWCEWQTKCGYVKDPKEYHDE